MLRLKCGVAVRYGDVQSGSPHKVTAFVAVLPHSCGDRTTGQSSALARDCTECTVVESRRLSVHQLE